MGAPFPWLAMAALATLINGSVLGFVAWREQSHALRVWAWAWVAWAAAIVPIALLGQSSHPLLVVGCGVFWVISTLCFLAGTYSFSGSRMARGWFAIAVLCVVLALALGMGPQATLGVFPLALFQSGGMFATGMLQIRRSTRHAGAWLCGIALILLALNVLITPVLAADPDHLQWGFVAAVSMEILAALGMLTLYYERAREELRGTQYALEQTRRSEALGRIAGGVAHDLNNILTVIQGHLDLIQAGWDDSQTSLSAIDEAAARARRLTAQLLAFGRRSVLQEQTVDIRSVVGDTVELLKKVVPPRVQLSFRCAPGDYLASIDQGLVEQIVLNLLANARDAIPHSGEVQVALERSDHPRQAIRITVEDDGVGMDTDVVAHVFEPFYTTRGSSGGTGLGLASVQGAVGQLGGQVTVQSKLGEGSKFEVLIPWVAPTQTSLPDSSVKRALNLEILLVDDEQEVRAVTAKMLQSAGHRVTQAPNGQEALQMLRARPYDVVLSDVVMPELGGVEVMQAASEERPETLVILTSGHPFDNLDARDVPFVPKPFQREELLVAISTRLAEHRSRKVPAADLCQG